MKKALFIYNPNAGKGLLKPKLSDIIDIIVKAGYEVVVYPTQKYKDAYYKVKTFTEEYDRVICSGGDGTLDEVVTGMMKREKKIVAAAQTPVIVQGAGQGTLLQTADVTAVESVSGDKEEKKVSGISEKVITCPLVGTFYSSPAPDAEDYVKVGDTVKKGQVIGIVEAMKLMNEIESEYDGIVEEILVKNEETVEYGQPLFRIR